MENAVFSPEQLETIQLKIIALICYARKHDSRPLPNYFRTCERIVRNIDISRADRYAERHELTRLIKDDWRSACHFRAGLPEYYIPSDDLEIRKSMNTALSKQIAEIEGYITAQF